MPWTKEQAREMSAKGLVVRRANRWDVRSKSLTQPQILSESYESAQERLSRLWDCLKLIDARVKHELAKENPNGALLKDLATTARILKDQTETAVKPASNGHKKPAPIAAPPDPLA